MSSAHASTIAHPDPNEFDADQRRYQARRLHRLESQVADLQRKLSQSFALRPARGGYDRPPARIPEPVDAERSLPELLPAPQA